jgi:hypothetical protein
VRLSRKCNGSLGKLVRTCEQKVNKEENLTLTFHRNLLILLGKLPPANYKQVTPVAVNRRVASSNLARGANFSFILNYLQTAIFSSFSFCGKLSRKCNGARFPYSRLLVFSTACRTCSAIPN